MSPLNTLATFKRKSGRYNDAGDVDTSDSLSVVLDARRKSSTFRSVLERFRAKRRSSATRTASSQASEQETPKLVVSFVNTLTVNRLSNFLTWFLFYDVVKLPESPSRWYKPICSMDMRGYIALGAFLSKNIPYGLDLVVLNSICDRLRLEKSIVRECLIRLADPQKMAWTALATTIHAAVEERRTEVETLELVQVKFQKLRALASSLQPTPGSEIANWQPKIITKLTELLKVVVNPRIVALRGGSGQLTEKTEDEVHQLEFLYEAMQQERQVPLIRYGIFPDMYLALSLLSSSASDKSPLAAPVETLVNDECELERSFSAHSLKSEIRLLRSRILQLEAENKNLETDKQKLVDSNDRLAKKISGVLGSRQPSLLQRRGTTSPLLLNTNYNGDRSELASAPNFEEGHIFPTPLNAPRNRGHVRCEFEEPQAPIGKRRRSASVDISILAPKTHVSPSDPASLMTLATTLSDDSDYCEVFRLFDDNPVPTPRLTDPKIGTETPPTSPPPRGRRLVRNIGVYDLITATAAHHQIGSSTSTLAERGLIYSEGVNDMATASKDTPDMNSSSSTRAEHGLIRNVGVPNLVVASGYSPTHTLPTMVTTTSRSASDSSKKSKAAADEPGPHNSIAEFRARQLNISPIQQPVEPYADKAATSPVRLRAAKSITRRMKRHISAEGLDTEEFGIGRKHSRSLKGVLNITTRIENKDQENDKPQDGDVSKNF